MSEIQNNAGLRLKNVRILLQGSLLLEVDEHVKPGEVLAVMGPSGSGKSTLLAWVAGFMDPAFEASGKTVLEGADVTSVAPEKRHMGLMFQDPLLFPHLSVGQNLLFAIPASVRARSDRVILVEQAMEQAGLPGYFDRDPATLSGGQQARIALMRLLLSQPKALLLDEPFSRLDVELRDQIRKFVFEQARERSLPVLLVTHDVADANSANAKRIFIGENGSKKQQGTNS